MDPHASTTGNYDTAAAAAQFRLAEKVDGISLADEVTENREMPTALLKEKVLQGRQNQVELTKRLQKLRDGHIEDALMSELADQRRLYHISTVLARAELLVRSQPSLSRYSGDEAKFDDLTILERAIGFLKVELQTAEQAGERAVLANGLTAFQAGEQRVEKTDY